jgi:hypothetical protein
MNHDNKEFGFRTIIKSFFNAFNIERGIVPTVRDLLLRPEKVINSYINGDREKYFSPARFLVTMVALLTASYFLLGWQELFQKMIYQSIEPELFNVAMGQMEAFQKFRLKLANTLDVLFMNPWAMILWIISSAFAGWIAFYKSSYNLVKQFVISIYYWPMIFVLMTLLSVVIYFPFYDTTDLLNRDIINEPLYNILTTLIFLIIFIWSLFVIKRVFKLRRFNLILRIFFFLILYFSFSIILFIISAILLMNYY